MSGFWGWFLVIVGVLAVFNAEKLPALRRMLEEKFKDSVDLAKESSKTLKDKVDKVKSDIDSKKNAPVQEQEPEENSPEEIDEALQFMGSYVKKEEETPVMPEESKVVAEQTVGEKKAATPEKEEAFSLESVFNDSQTKTEDADKPIDLEHRY